MTLLLSSVSSSRPDDLVPKQEIRRQSHLVSLSADGTNHALTKTVAESFCLQVWKTIEVDQSTRLFRKARGLGFEPHHSLLLYYYLCMHSLKMIWPTWVEFSDKLQGNRLQPQAFTKRREFLHIFPSTSHIFPKTSHIFPKTSHIFPSTSHIFPKTHHLANSKKLSTCTCWTSKQFSNWNESVPQFRLLIFFSPQQLIGPWKFEDEAWNKVLNWMSNLSFIWLLDSYCHWKNLQKRSRHEPPSTGSGNSQWAWFRNTWSVKSSLFCYMVKLWDYQVKLHRLVD